MTDSEFRLEERILCEDDTCIGLVGADGRCRECGKKYTGDLSALKESHDSVTLNDTAGNDGKNDLESTAAEEPEAGDIDDRILCADDTCIGVIGADGRCGTCGRSR